MLQKIFDNMEISTRISNTKFPLGRCLKFLIVHKNFCITSTFLWKNAARI